MKEREFFKISILARFFRTIKFISSISIPIKEFTVRPNKFQCPILGSRGKLFYANCDETVPKVGFSTFNFSIFSELIQQATKFEDPEGFGFICEEQNFKSRSFVRFMICDNKNSGKKFDFS